MIIINMLDNKILQEQRPGIVERADDPVPLEKIAQDGADEFEGLGRRLVDKEPVEKEPPESRGGVGAIRIE